MYRHLCPDEKRLQIFGEAWKLYDIQGHGRSPGPAGKTDLAFFGVTMGVLIWPKLLTKFTSSKAGNGR
jgi:hypothetical protein